MGLQPPNCSKLGAEPSQLLPPPVSEKSNPIQLQYFSESESEYSHSISTKTDTVRVVGSFPAPEYALGTNSKKSCAPRNCHLNLVDFSPPTYPAFLLVVSGN